MKYKLEDLCIFNNGGAWSETEYVKDGIPVIKVSNIKNSTVSTDNLSFISKNSYDKYKKHEVKKGDIIIATVGSHPTLPNSAAGRSITISKTFEGYLLNQNAVCIRSKNPEILDQSFLGYLTKSEIFINFIQKRGAGAANQMRIPIGAIKSFNFSTPPLKTQKQIAKILSNYDDLIENNLERIILLEETLRLTYEEWFLRFRIDGQKLEICPETKIPIGWKKVPLTEFIDLVRGVEPGSNAYEEVKTEKNIPFIRVGDLGKRESGIYVSKELVGTKIIDEEDILLSLDGSPGMVKFGLKGSYSTGIRRAIAKKKNISNIFIYNLLNSPHIQGIIDAHSTGTTILHAGSSVKKMEILLPTDRILDNYNDVEMKKFQLILNLNKKNQLLKEARDILLPRLMTGMIDTDNMDIAV